jgi:hypothetical protein
MISSKQALIAAGADFRTEAAEQKQIAPEKSSRPWKSPAKFLRR